MNYCKNCGRQLQDDEQCNCSNASTEASDTAASTEEGIITETYDYFNSYSEVSTTPMTDTTTNQETNPNNQGYQSNYTYQWDQTYQSNDVSYGDHAFQSNDAYQGNQASQSNDVSQGNQTFQSNDTSQGNQASQENASDFTQEGPDSKQKAGKSGVFSTALKNVLPFIKAFVKAPSSALHTSAENTDLPLAGIFYAAYCFSWILFQVLVFSKLYGLITGYTSYLLSFGQNYIKISYPYVILTTLISSLLFVVITNLFTICLGFITHSKYNFKQIIAATSGIFVFPTICFLLATILFFIRLPISICVLLVGIVAYLLLFFYIGKALFQKNDNSPFLWIMILLTATLFIITTFSSLKITSSFSSKLVRTDISYDFFGNESYDHYSDLDDFDQFFE